MIVPLSLSSDNHDAIIHALEKDGVAVLRGGVYISSPLAIPSSSRLVIEREGERERLLQFLLPVRDGESDARAQPRGLDDDGITDYSAPSTPSAPSSSSPATPAQNDSGYDSGNSSYNSSSNSSGSGNSNNDSPYDSSGNSSYSDTDDGDNGSSYDNDDDDD